MDYEKWNLAIGRFIFSADRADEPAYLAIDREVIQAIARQHRDPEIVGDAVEDFLLAVRGEIARFGWDGRINDLASDRIPGFVGLLAAQVVAAFDMHEDGDYTDTAYWPRLNELLEADRGYAMPEGLKSEIHQSLWENLRHWANDMQGTRWGRVRLADTNVHHKHVALPLGQCSLRRGDLDRLWKLFGEYGKPPPQRLSNDDLEQLIGYALDDQPHRFFSNHARRMLRRNGEDSGGRYEDALDQILAEYDRFLQNEDKRQSRPRRKSRDFADSFSSRTAVWLTLRNGLRGGLCTFQGDRWMPQRDRMSLDGVLNSFYLRQGRAIVNLRHKPPRDDRLLAIWSEEDAAFIEKRRARPGDRAILLVPAWNRSDWINQTEWLAVPDSLRRYRSTEEIDRVELTTLEGLPPGWVALEFQVHDDLSGEQFGPEWEGMLTRETYLRTEGGLLLGRRGWMAGAGPTLRVVGADRPEHIWIDGRTYLADESGCVTRYVASALDCPGQHRAWLPGRKSVALRFIVANPRIDERSGPDVAWHRTSSGWPVSPGDSRARPHSPPDSLLGPRLAGQWQPCAIATSFDNSMDPGSRGTVSESRLALDLLRVLRGGPEMPALGSTIGVDWDEAKRSANPLLRGLLKAISLSRRTLGES